MASHPAPTQPVLDLQTEFDVRNPAQQQSRQSRAKETTIAPIQLDQSGSEQGKRHVFGEVGVRTSTDENIAFLGRRGLVRRCTVTKVSPGSLAGKADADGEKDKVGAERWVGVSRPPDSL